MCTSSCGTTSQTRQFPIIEGRHSSREVGFSLTRTCSLTPSLSQPAATHLPEPTLISNLVFLVSRIVWNCELGTVCYSRNMLLFNFSLTTSTNCWNTNINFTWREPTVFGSDLWPFNYCSGVLGFFNSYCINWQKKKTWSPVDGPTL